MGSESIAHEAEGRMGHWLRGHESERNNNIIDYYCSGKIQLVGQKSIKAKHLSLVKANPFLPPKHYKYSGRFWLLLGLM